MGSPRRQSQSHISPEGGVYPTLPVQTSPDQKSNHNKLLCRSSQEQLPVRGIASAVKQECCRIGSKPSVPGFLQPVISGSKTQQAVASYLGSEQTKQLSENTVFQDGDSGNHTDIPPDGEVGHLCRLQRRILPHPYKQPIQEVHAFSHPRQNLPVQCTTLWSVHSSHGVHSDSQRSQMASNETGYKDPPVPRRLVGQGFLSPGLSSTHSNPSNPMQRIGVAGQRGKVRTGAQTGFQLRRLPVRPETRQGHTYHRTLASSTKQDKGDHVKPKLSDMELNVPDRIVNCHRKAGSFGQVTHETHTVASQKQLEGTRDSGENHPHPKITPPTFKMVAGGRQCYHRSTLTPFSTRPANLYRRIKRRVGRSLRRAYSKGKLVTTRKQTAYKLPRVKSSSSGLKGIPVSLHKQSSSHSYRQHHCGSIHKQGRGNEVGTPVCLALENPHLVHQKPNNSQSPTYPRSFKCDSRQTIQTGSDHPN